MLVSLSSEAEERFVNYEWPGNVRELENTIRQMVVMKSNPVVEISDLPTQLRSQDLINGNGSDAILPLDELERRHILKAMDYTNADINVAAGLLGISKTTLYPQAEKSMKRPGGVMAIPSVCCSRWRCPPLGVGVAVADSHPLLPGEHVGNSLMLRWAKKGGSHRRAVE